MKRGFFGGKSIRKGLISLGCFVALLAVFSAFLFLLVEAGHQCDDDDCPVCACMQMCEEQLHRLGESLATGIIALIVFCCCAFAYKSVRLFFVEDTPVSRKVRLNN